MVISRTMKTRKARLPTVSGRRAATQDVRTCLRKEVWDEGLVFSDTGSMLWWDWTEKKGADGDARRSCLCVVARWDGTV